jgi:hypothetical protein
MSIDEIKAEVVPLKKPTKRADANQLPADPSRSRFIDWGEFWTKELDEREWLPGCEDVLALGRGHSMFAKGKTGKSLFMLWQALQAIQRGVVCVYLDYEMSEKDLRDRLEDMGYDERADLSLLHYWRLPDIAALDTLEGGQSIDALLDELQFAHPGAPVLVVIDTYGRAVAGAENDNDTTRDFYRFTGYVLKQHGVTWIRIDHEGHSDNGHARGGSAKLDDIDIAYQLKTKGVGVDVSCVGSRVSFTLPETSWTRHNAGDTTPLRYERVGQIWMPNEISKARELAAAGVPADLPGRDAAQLFRKNGGKGKTNLISRAQLYRQKVSD